MEVLKNKSGNSTNISDKDIKKLLELAGSINFGSITLLFQDGKLIQIEKNEKVRVG